MNFQMFKLDLEKAEEPETKLPTSLGSSKKQESSRKTSISALLTMPNQYTTNCVCIVDHNKLWKLLKDVEITDHLKSVCKSRATVRKGHGTRTDSKLGKEYNRAVCCPPVGLTYMLNTS